MPDVISTINTTLMFDFNVEEYIQCSKTFEWYVGEGPLYWYRIYWKKPICAPNNCTPSITNCSITATDCDCTPPPPSCVSPNENPCTPSSLEIWHMMATSVAHLCARLNTECCNRQLDKVFWKVQRYGRPALCCDVDDHIKNNIPMTDEYIDVDFCECECVNWVDPCDCGDITVPCAADVPLNRCQVSADEMPPDIIPSMQMFGLLRKTADVLPGFVAENVEIIQANKQKIVARNGAALTSILACRHNLIHLEPLKQFLTRHKQTLGDLTLSYDSTADSWQNTTHFVGVNEKWTIFIKWACIEVAKHTYEWNLMLLVSRVESGVRRETKLILSFMDSDLFKFTLDLPSKSIVKGGNVLKQQVIQDDIGLFRGAKTLDFSIERQ